MTAHWSGARANCHGGFGSGLAATFFAQPIEIHRSPYIGLTLNMPICSASNPACVQVEAQSTIWNPAYVSRDSRPSEKRKTAWRASGKPWAALVDAVAGTGKARLRHRFSAGTLELEFQRSPVFFSGPAKFDRRPDEMQQMGKSRRIARTRESRHFPDARNFPIFTPFTLSCSKARRKQFVS